MKHHYRRLLLSLSPPVLFVSALVGTSSHHHHHSSSSSHSQSAAASGISNKGSTVIRTLFPPSIISSTSSVSTSTKLHMSLGSGSSNNYNNNPFSSMIGDVASSLFGGGTTKLDPSISQRIEESLSKSSSQQQPIYIKSWIDIQKDLSTVQTMEERAFRQDLVMGYGTAGSPMNKIRLYDESNEEKDIQVTFYRDSASWCPYCQKVWLALELKRIPYRVEKINMSCYGTKPSSFIRIQPGGQIPVAQIKGTIYGQSNDILQALEKEFPNHGPALMPNDVKNMARAQELFTLERQLFSAWMGWLTGRGGGSSKQNFDRTLQYVDSILQKDGPFFMGKDISMVDIQFASFLERMAASMLYFKGYMIRVTPPAAGEYSKFPGINAWFDAMEELPAYQLTKSDYYTHCWDLPPQLGGCTSEPAGKIYQDAINGIRTIDGTRGSWDLPLQRDNGGIEPDWDWAAPDDATARREAVERVSANHDAIVKFACRGAGRKGMPPVSAPLSDPNAIPNETVQGIVDQCLRTVCCALLTGSSSSEENDNHIVSIRMEEQTTIMKGLASAMMKEGGSDCIDAVVASLSYFRDRIGVPRDMRLPAARQLRAHMNWSIGIILSTSLSSSSSNV